MDAEGIAAEVVFPNTVPPFYPSNTVTAPAPRTAEEHALRWAGVQAHNRWMADFCSLAPERRIGLAQVFLEDVDAAVAEVEWAREAGLRGVLVPGDHPAKLVPIHGRELDPFWAACAALGMPVHRHGVSVGDEDDVNDGASGALAAHENEFYFTRALPQLVFGAVFERHPDLKFVFAECGLSWAVRELAKLDAEIAFGRREGHAGYPVFHQAAERLTMSPSERFRTNCWIGASIMRPQEMALRGEIGVDRIMWGSDYPHTEGVFPHATLSMRLLLAELSEAEARLVLSENAASVYGLDMGPLQAIADRIGPTVDLVATPVTAAELPERSMSGTVITAAELVG
jgi:predicted TIM-barrel fold metal-dependent hydrolase